MLLSPIGILFAESYKWGEYEVNSSLGRGVETVGE